MISQSFVPLGYQQLSSTAIASSAVSLTVPAGATDVLLTAEANTVRWRDDETAPTSTVGMPMRDTDPPLQYSGNLSALQFIAGGSGAILNASFYRRAG